MGVHMRLACDSALRAWRRGLGLGRTAFLVLIFMGGR